MGGKFAKANTTPYVSVTSAGKQVFKFYQPRGVTTGSSQATLEFSTKVLSSKQDSSINKYFGW